MKTKKTFRIWWASDLRRVALREDYGFHFRGFLIGTVLVLATSVPIAGVVARLV